MNECLIFVYLTHSIIFKKKKICFLFNLEHNDIARFQSVIALIEQETERRRSEKLTRSTELSHSESSEFCPICYSAPIDTTFVPCHHRSCHMCIQRHLLN